MEGINTVKTSWYDPFFKEPISLKFETVSYFLKSCKKLLYSWANKIGQHSGSSLKDMCLITPM